MSDNDVQKDFFLFSRQAPSLTLNKDAYEPKKLKHMYMNRIAIDEDDQNEIYGIHELKEIP